MLVRWSLVRAAVISVSFFFFFKDPPPTEIYTLSLHDALPIYSPSRLQRIGASGSSAGTTRGAADPMVKIVSCPSGVRIDRKSTRLNSSHTVISYAVFCLKKKKTKKTNTTRLQPTSHTRHIMRD